MADYSFYTGVYQGDSIPAEEFPRLALRAEAQLTQYKLAYRVAAPAPDSEAMAVCAMADALYCFEVAQSGGVVAAVSVGSVSSTFRDPGQDLSPRSQARELYRCARLYLDIYRGCGRC